MHRTPFLRNVALPTLARSRTCVMNQKRGLMISSDGKTQLC